MQDGLRLIVGRVRKCNAGKVMRHSRLFQPFAADLSGRFFDP
ncbi:MAG: hypothetical protein U0903_17060 [Planctomycetales bacterium]